MFPKGSLTLAVAFLAWVTPTLQAAISNGQLHEEAAIPNHTAHSDLFRKGNKSTSHAAPNVTPIVVPLTPVSLPEPYLHVAPDVAPLVPVWANGHRHKSTPVKITMELSVDHKKNSSGSHEPGPRPVIGVQGQDPAVESHEKMGSLQVRGVRERPRHTLSTPYIKVGCPVACERNGHIQSPSHWSRAVTDYHLKNCKLPMLVHHPVTERTPLLARGFQRVCTLPDYLSNDLFVSINNRTANLPHPYPDHQKTAAKAGCGTPKSTTSVPRTLRITDLSGPEYSWPTVTTYIAKYNALITQMTRFFDSPTNCGRTEVFGYWRYGIPSASAHDWAVTVGMYKGVGLTAASVDNVARKLFEKNGGETQYEVLEVCDAETEGKDRTVGIKVYPTVKFIPVKEAVDVWKKGKCLSRGVRTETVEVQVMNAEY